MGRACEVLLKGLSQKLVEAFSTGLAYVAPMNFGRVNKDIIRTMQLSKAQLMRLHRRENFRSIVNLRGYHPGRSWYDNESDFASENNVDIYSVAISSKVAPLRETLLDLVYALENCEKPALVHCTGGADRAGFASAVYRLLENDSASDASDELCMKHGHLSKSVLDRIIASYGAVENEMGFGEWVEKEYSSEDFE